MELTPVNSSSIAAAGYDEATRTLRIRFTSEAEYDYLDVPPEIFKTLMAVESKGRYHAERIRANYEYRCVKQRAPKEEKDATQAESKAKPKAVAPRKRIS